MVKLFYKVQLLHLAMPSLQALVKGLVAAQ